MAPRLAVLVCLLLAFTAAPALASCGGLYTPGVTQKACAPPPDTQQNYYRSLGSHPSRAQIARGRFLDGLAPASADGASSRAGIDAGTLGLAPFAILAALATGLALPVTRRRVAL